MVAHVNLVAYLEAVLLSGALHELPVAAGAGRRGDALQAALDDAEVLHVCGHTLLLENAFDGRKIARGAFDVEEGVRLVVHVGDQLTVQPLAYIVDVQRHPFAAEREGVGNRGGVDAVVGADGTGVQLFALLLACGENKGFPGDSQRSQYDGDDRQFLHCCVSFRAVISTISCATSFLLMRGLSLRLPSRPMMVTLLVSTPKPAPLSRSELRTM